MIAASTFHFGDAYAWVSARTVHSLEKHFMITRDDKEVTAVTTEENLAGVDVIERNRHRWRLVMIDCASPFYCVGFIAKIAAALSGAS